MKFNLPSSFRRGVRVGRRFFPSRIGMQSFIVLLVGFILIQAAGLTVFSRYRVLEKREASRWEVANQLIKVATIAKTLPRSELLRLINVVNSPTLQVSLDNQPLKHSQRIANTNPTLIQQAVLSSRSNSAKIALRLSDGLWMNIISTPMRSKWWILASYLLAVVFMCVASLFLCAWSVKRLADPLARFAKAAKRLGVDVNAPPLPETGSEEMHEVIHTFNEMQSRIRRLINDRTRMLAAISHDLRTPITRLKLRAEFVDDEKQQGKIIADLADMEAMISSTLAFARDDFLEENLEKFDLDALLDTITGEMADTNHPVSYESYGQHFPYRGRTLALKRAFTNLIENAVKYGDVAHVRLTCRDDSAVVEIDDNGPGIPEQHLNKVFEPFYRVETSRSRETGGTGLGLAVAHDVIRAHGGEVKLLNRAGSGLRALVTLPVSL